jgi:hypothetical protein
LSDHNSAMVRSQCATAGSLAALSREPLEDAYYAAGR